MQVWRNWQTRMVQVHVGATPCRFNSCYLHQKERSTQRVGLSFGLVELNLLSDKRNSHREFQENDERSEEVFCPVTCTTMEETRFSNIFVEKRVPSYISVLNI